MATHDLALYRVHTVKPRAAQKETQQRLAILSDINGLDVVDAFVDYLELQVDAGFINDESDQTHMSVSFYSICSQGRCVWGVISSGQYGVKGKIKNIKTGEEKYDKEVDDADITDRLFLFFAPKEKDEAILVLHNVRGHGFKGVLSKGFREYFRAKTGLFLRFPTLSYDKAVEKWLDGNVKEVVATGFKFPTAIEDSVDGLGHEQVDVVLKPPRKRTFGSFRNFKGDSKPKAISYLEQESAVVKALVEVDGKTRTFTISGSGGVPVTRLEVEPNVFDTEGIPDFIKMRDNVVEVVNELCQSIYGKSRIRICLVS